MRKQFIPELGQILSGERLDIWLGKDENGKPLKMPVHKREAEKARLSRMAKQGIKVESVPKEGVRQPCGCGKKKKLTPQTPPLPG